MAKYQLVLTDMEGDKLTIDIVDNKISMKGTKFDMEVTPDKLKNLGEIAVSTGSILTDFKLKSFLIEQVA